MSTVFFISAPSGSGKSTLVRNLLNRSPNLLFSVSYTTREPRGGEIAGEDYHYIAREEFERLIDKGEFLEWAQVFGHYYGTHRSMLERAVAEGKDLLLDIDVQGARQLKESIPGAVTVFILAPSREVLEQRLRSRSAAEQRLQYSGDIEPVIQRRLRKAAEEIRNYDQYDYVLVNDDLDRSTETLAAVVTAERVRRVRVEPVVRSILATFGRRKSPVIGRSRFSMARNAINIIPDDPETSTYRFIIVAAKRARQLQNGARSFLPSTSKKPTVAAMEEVRRGLVQYNDPLRDAALENVPAE
jgi:guanylate kinase